jgi:hypothetical protein
MIEDKLALVVLANTYKTYRSSRWLSATMNYVLIYKIFKEHFEDNNYSQECFGIKLQLSSYVYLVTNIFDQLFHDPKINLKNNILLRIISLPHKE